MEHPMTSEKRTPPSEWDEETRRAYEESVERNRELLERLAEL